MSKKYYIGFRKKGGSIFSCLIRMFTFSKYSHCYLLINNEEYIEADGFKKLSKGKITQDRIEEYDFFKLKEEYENKCNYNDMDKYITEVLGTNYGYGDITLIAVSKMSGIWQRLIRKIYPQTNNQIICSEFISQCYHHAGICLFDNENICKLPSPKQVSESKKIIKITEEEKRALFQIKATL